MEIAQSEMNGSSESEFIRTFLAIPLIPFEKSLSDVILQAQKLISGVKWIHPAHGHLTLHFLGDIEKKQIPVIKSIVGQAAETHKPFRINLNHLGYFPNPQTPRVVWIGVGGDTQRITELQEEIGKALGAHHFQLESRPFVPHITLGRSKRNEPLLFLKENVAAKIRIDHSFQNIGHLILFQSLLKPNGPEYYCLESFPLSQI